MVQTLTKISLYKYIKKNFSRPQLWIEQCNLLKKSITIIYLLLLPLVLRVTWFTIWSKSIFYPCVLFNLLCKSNEHCTTMNNKVPIDKLFRYCRFTLHYNQLFKLYSSVEYRCGGSVVESSPRMQDMGFDPRSEQTEVVFK